MTDHVAVPGHLEQRLQLDDGDLWLDRDGKVYRGDGPFLDRPLRRLRRWLRPRSTRWWR